MPRDDVVNLEHGAILAIKGTLSGARPQYARRGDGGRDGWGGWVSAFAIFKLCVLISVCPGNHPEFWGGEVMQ